MADNPEDELKNKKVVALDEDDIALLKTYVRTQMRCGFVFLFPFCAVGDSSRALCFARGWDHTPSPSNSWKTT